MFTASAALASLRRPLLVVRRLAGRRRRLALPPVVDSAPRTTTSLPPDRCASVRGLQSLEKGFPQISSPPSHLRRLAPRR